MRYIYYRNLLIQGITSMMFEFLCVTDYFCCIGDEERWGKWLTADVCDRWYAATAALEYRHFKSIILKNTFFYIHIQI